MIRISVFATAAFLAACTSLPAASPQVSSFDVAEAQRLFEAQAENFPAMNATVMVDGVVVWEAEGGLLRNDRDGVETDYNIYSIAKMLTGMAYARLESDGIVELDQPILAIEPRLPDAYKDVTLRQLLNHTAGVRHYKSDNDWISFSDMRCEKPQDALGHFVEDPLSGKPGYRYKYSTFGFTLLSHLLTQITGDQTYDAAMTTVLGDRFLAKTDSEDAEKAVTFIGEPNAFKEVHISAECKYGGGGLLASARGLAGMGAALAKGDIVPLVFANKNFAPRKSGNGKDVNYAYGMSVGYSESAQTNYSMHSGGSPGGRGFLLVYYGPRVSVGVTSNYDGPHHADLSIALGHIFSGLPATSENDE